MLWQRRNCSGTKRVSVSAKGRRRETAGPKHGGEACSQLKQVFLFVHMGFLPLRQSSICQPWSEEDVAFIVRGKSFQMGKVGRLTGAGCNRWSEQGHHNTCSRQDSHRGQVFMQGSHGGHITLRNKGGCVQDGYKQLCEPKTRSPFLKQASQNHL